MSQELDKSFSILHVNSRSIKSNFDNIVNFLHCSDFNIKVLGLTETWMNDAKGDTYDQYNIHGYSVYYVNRIKKGGGVSLYINDELQHKSIKELSYSIVDCFDVVTVEIKESQANSFYVSCLYRPPNVCMKYFLEHYTAFIQKLNGKKVFICGDFNIDLVKNVISVETNNFLDLVYTNGQYPLISLPTRITSSSATAIDNIFTNVLDKDVISKVIINDITDHLPVLCFIPKQGLLKKKQ